MFDFKFVAIGAAVLFVIGSLVLFFYKSTDEISPQAVPLSDPEPPPEDLHVIVDRQSRIGYMDKEGTVRISSRFVTGTVFRNGRACVVENGSGGFINKRGQYVIEPNLNNCSYFYHGRAPVERNGKWGVINRKGEPVVPFKFDKAGTFRSQAGIAWVVNDKKYGFIDSDGQQITEIHFSSVKRFSEGMGAFKRTSKWGFLNVEGHVEIIPTFDQVKPFRRGLAPAKKMGQWGVINKQGETVIDFQYDEVDQFHEGLAGFKSNENWGYITREGDVKIQPEYREAYPFKEGLAAVRTKDGKIGFVNKEGTMVIDPIFDGILFHYDYIDYGFRDGLVSGIVEGEHGHNRLGWINKAGEFVWGPEGSVHGHWVIE